MDEAARNTPSAVRVEAFQSKRGRSIPQWSQRHTAMLSRGATGAPTRARIASAACLLSRADASMR